MLIVVSPFSARDLRTDRCDLDCHYATKEKNKEEGVGVCVGEGGCGVRGGGGRLKTIAHQAIFAKKIPPAPAPPPLLPPVQLARVEKQSPAEIRILDSGIPAMV